MINRVVQIEGVGYDQMIAALGDMMGGKFINVNDVPDVDLNAKQSARFLGVAHNTLIRLMESGEVTNTGAGATLRFSLSQLFRVRPNIEQLRYKRANVG